MKETFSFSSALKSSWNLIKTYWKFLVPALVVTAVIYILLQILQGASERHWAFYSVVMILSFIVTTAITIGWTNVILKLIRNTSDKWNDFKTDYRLWWHYILAQVIFSFFILIAAALIVVPVLILTMVKTPQLLVTILCIIIVVVGVGLILWLMIRYMFIQFIVLDNPKLRGWAVLQKNAVMTRGHMVDLFGFVVLLTLVNILGALLLFIGLVVTIPLTKIAKAYAYEYLREKYSAQ